jgi:hypothetical protein
VTVVERLLESLLEEHRRIGSPLDRYLRRPGRDASAIRNAFGDAVVPPAAESWFGWQDGIDEEAWVRDSPGPSPELFWSGEPIGLAQSVDERTRRLALNLIAPQGAEPWRSDPGEYWPPELVPILRGGGSLYGMECRPGPGFGQVWLVHPAPAGADPSRPAFPSLTALLEGALARLRSGFYVWDPGSSSMQAGSAERPWLLDDAPTDAAPVEAPEAAILRAVEAIEAFARREGHARIPEGQTEGGFALGAVASSYRLARRELPPEIRDRLGRLPGWEWRS